MYPTPLNRIRSSDPLDRIYPITPYAHYPFEEENGEQSFSRDVWMKPVKAAAISAAEWLQETNKAHKAVNALLDYRASAWQKRTLTASDQAAVMGTAARGAAVTTYIVEVTGLAQRQRNQGYALAAAAGSVIEAGLHTFTAAVRGRAVSLSADISPSDTNAAALACVRDTVNQAGLGIDAQVVASGSGVPGTVSLALTASAAGTHGAFSIADTKGSAIAAIGAGMLMVPAADAVYAVDGHSAVHAQTNIVSLDGGKVTLQLIGLTGDPASVKIELDCGAVVEQITDIVNAVNRLDQLFDAEPAYLKPSLRKELELAMASGSSGGLGISRRVSSGWKIDSAKLTAALNTEPESVQRQLTDRSGWAPAIGRTLERFSQIPVQDLLDPSAQMMQGYTVYLATRQPYWQLPSNGWYLNAFS